MKSFKKLFRDFKIRLVLVVLIPSLLLNAYLLFTSGQKDKLTSEKKQVVRVIDGDTFDVEGDIRIRLAGANAPEYPKGCLSEQAKTRLSELVLGKKVGVRETGKDNFGRSIAFVFYGDLSIDQTMVSEGLAKAVTERESQYSAYLLSKQEEAQLAKRGIWSDLCTQPPNKECVIKGNARKGISKIYHLPDCYNYEKIVVNESLGDRWFCSQKEAEAAGFRLSSDCPQ